MSRFSALAEIMAEVSLGHSYPEPLRVTGPLPSLVLRAEDMWQRYNQCLEVGGALNQGFPFSPLMSHFRGLRDGLEYKFLDCFQDRHQLRNLQCRHGRTRRRGGRLRETVYAASRECVVILALGDLVTLEAFCKVLERSTQLFIMNVVYKLRVRQEVH